MLSFVNARSRGRLPTWMDLATFSVRGSTNVMELSDSLVTATHRPFGVVTTPSGSRPTGMRATTSPLPISTTVRVPLSSFATNSRRPSALRANCSGSEPACNTRVTLSVVVSTMAMPSAVRSRLSLAHSSSGTLGGHFGSPLTATNSREPSRLSLSPRGRFPTEIVEIASARAVSEHGDRVAILVRDVCALRVRVSDNSARRAGEHNAECELAAHVEAEAVEAPNRQFPMVSQPGRADCRIRPMGGSRLGQIGHAQAYQDVSWYRSVGTVIQCT